MRNPKVSKYEDYENKYQWSMPKNSKIEPS